ncbi:MAG: hypothetical protein ABIH86_05190 [Planctomycetota bacterium]
MEKIKPEKMDSRFRGNDRKDIEKKEKMFSRFGGNNKTCERQFAAGFRGKMLPISSGLSISHSLYSNA